MFDRIPERMPDIMSEFMPDRMSECMSDTMPKYLPPPKRAIGIRSRLAQLHPETRREDVEEKKEEGGGDGEAEAVALLS